VILGAGRAGYGAQIDGREAPVNHAHIVFSDGLKLVVEHEEADTKALTDRLSDAGGGYLRLHRPGGVRAVFVNPVAVAFIEDSVE
jgi:hypothetical protein